MLAGTFERPWECYFLKSVRIFVERIVLLEVARMGASKGGERSKGVLSILIELLSFRVSEKCLVDKMNI
jgi:hypothetical protein